MGNTQYTIHQAARLGLVDTIRSQLEQDSRLVDSFDEENFTALHYACQFGHEEVVRLLIQEQANVDKVETAQHLSPLHFAAKFGNAAVAKLLIEKGAQVNATTIHKQTPLYLACLEDRYSVTKTLLELGAHVNIRDERNLTALHRAALNERADIMHLLLKHGATVDDNDLKNHPAIRRALSCQDTNTLFRMVAGEDTDRFPKPDYSTSVFPENYNIDDFIVEKELTRGPQSRILLCKTRELEPENVLIKLYPRKREANSCRGVGEYAAIRSLNSGNIIKMIRYFELRDAILGSYFCIALPYYPNGDLNTVIQDCKTRNTLVPAADASRYAYYIAKGLNAVHDKNIIHCALKPSNILLSNDPKTLVISDFGFSKVVSESSDNVDVHKFCSPEMRQGQYGQPTDVWSYGCLLYALLTGKDVDLAEELQTARENDAEEELRQSLRNDMSSLRIYNNGLIDLVMSTLRIEPAERPKTLEILELDLFSTFKEEEDGTAECIICMVSPKTHACVPCGHKVLCEDNTCISMALQAGKCPICRVDVHDCIRIL